MESVLLTTPHSYLVTKQDKGNLWAKSFIGLKANIDKPLSAILSLGPMVIKDSYYRLDFRFSFFIFTKK